jgi:hypothetical protein
MLHGFEIVSNILSRIIDKSPAQRQKLLSRVKADWEKNFGDFNVFVSAFSERGDTLEQWRAYTPRGGCSIGFSSTELRDAAHERNFWMLPCLYSAFRKRERLSKLLQLNENGFEQAGQNELEFFADNVCSDFMVEIARFKHFAFRSEREWRLFMFDNVLDHTDRLEFSARDSGLVPRLSLSFPVSAIKQIVLSPHSSLDTEFGAEWFLQAEGFQHVKVLHSRVPLRA